MTAGGPGPVLAYDAWLQDRKQALFALYAGERLDRKMTARGAGWTWGYRLIVSDQAATGASIGEDEIRFCLDLPHLIDARYAYCVGVAFGVSTFALALSKPDLTVFGIDNYSEREGGGTTYARQLVERCIREQVPNVRLHVGTSPQDAAACLATLPPGEKLSIVFIDGLHEDAAAAADFAGVHSYMDSRTVVLWHNVDTTRRAFATCFDPQWFDTACVLRTHGVIGMYFNRRVHPALDAHLRQHSLLWDNWEQHLAALDRVPPRGRQARLGAREKQLVNFLRRLRGVKTPAP